MPPPLSREIKGFKGYTIDMALSSCIAHCHSSSPTQRRACRWSWFWLACSFIEFCSLLGTRCQSTSESLILLQSAPSGTDDRFFYSNALSHTASGRSDSASIAATPGRRLRSLESGQICAKKEFYCGTSDVFSSDATVALVMSNCTLDHGTGRTKTDCLLQSIQ